MRNSRAKNSSRGGGENELDLHAAARSGDLQKVESICNSNPLAVNSRDKHSRTPLHLAAWSGQTEVVSYLCKHKADVGAAAMDDTGAIHFASQKGHLEVVRTLLSSGVSVKATNRKGFTPLHYAVQGSYLDLIKYLIRKGANLSAKTKSGQTPMDLANSEEVRSFLAECEQSLEKGDKSTSKNVDEAELKEPVKEDGIGSTTTEKVDATPKEPVKDDNIDSDAKQDECDAREKRKVEENAEESLLGSKKARVSLQHLVAEDDTEDNGEEQ